MHIHIGDSKSVRLRRKMHVGSKRKRRQKYYRINLPVFISTPTSVERWSCVIVRCNMLSTELTSIYMCQNVSTRRENNYDARCEVDSLMWDTHDTGIFNEKKKKNAQNTSNALQTLHVAVFLFCFIFSFSLDAAPLVGRRSLFRWRPLWFWYIIESLWTLSNLFDTLLFLRFIPATCYTEIPVLMRTVKC